MSYRAALEYLDSFVNYEKKSSYPYKESLKLERIRGFLRTIGDPQDSFKSIHVAGTKGKGSVCALCASILGQSGYRTGLYTSPHLCDVRERIRIFEPRSESADEFAGMIPQPELEKLVSCLQPVIEDYSRTSRNGPLSFFEVYTALAFAYFRENKIDVAVLETGLGGRLDATNVVRPAVCGITAISLDHTNKLGSTLEEIAAEKAGIIKEGIPVVSAPQYPQVEAVLRERALRNHADFYLLGQDVIVLPQQQTFRGQQCSIRGLSLDMQGIALALAGRHQATNAGVAVALAKLSGLAVTQDDLVRGLEKCRWPGRFEVISEEPAIVLDGAHNQASAQALRQTLDEVFPLSRKVFVLGISSDKDAVSICRALIPAAASVIVTQADNPRAIPCAELARIVRSVDPAVRVESALCIKEALSIAQKESKQGIMIVTGSLFVVGEARGLLKGLRK